MNFAATLGLALPIGIGLAAIGSGIGLGFMGRGAMEAMGRQPEVLPKIQVASDRLRATARSGCPSAVHGHRATGCRRSRIRELWSAAASEK